MNSTAQVLMYNHIKVKYAAIYLRKSRGESIDDLKKHRILLTDFCLKYGIQYVIYEEIANSDSIDMRPELLRLLADVEQGLFDAVIVADNDRLGRGDLGEQDRIKKSMLKEDTLIVTPEKIYDLRNDDDDTYYDLKGFFARQEYKMIVKRFTRGKKIGARDGKWTNGTPPFPYVYERYKEIYNPKGLVINEERFVVYREMIEMALSNVPPQRIAEIFNNRGILTVKGCYWSGVTIQRLLIDETHLGKIISNKSKGDGHKIKRPNTKKAQNIPQTEWVIVDDCHAPVKTQEEHDEILKLICARKTHFGYLNRKSYSFSGMIECAHCGHKMTFYVRSNKTLMKPCWYTYPTGEKCRNSGIDVSFIEDYVLKEIQNKLDDNSFSIIDTKQDNEELELCAKRMSQLQENLSTLKKAVDRINDAFEMGVYERDEWINRRKNRENEIAKIQEEMKNLGEEETSQEATPILSEEERRSALKEFITHIDTCTSEEERNALYHTIIEKVIWQKNEQDIAIEIKFK